MQLSGESFLILRGNMLGLDRWIGEGVRLSNQLDRISDGEISGRFTAGMLGALTIRDPKHPAIVSWIERSTEVLNQTAGINLQQPAEYPRQLPRAYSLLAGRSTSSPHNHPTPAANG